METTTLAQTSDRTAHYQRVRAIVKRLVIDLGYLERCQAEGIQDVRFQIAVAGLDASVDDLNTYLEVATHEKAPAAETDAESGNLPVVYPTEEP